MKASQILLLLILTAGTDKIAGSPRLELSTPFVDLPESRFDHLTLFRYAVIASGVTEPFEIEAYEEEYQTLWHRSTQYLEESSGLPKGEALLQFLHETVFKRYVEGESGIDTLFEKGLFNCVSSAVLYTLLGWGNGLKIYGVVTEDHAFSTIEMETQFVDVEVTTLYGYNPGEKKEFISDFSKRTGFVYVPRNSALYRDEVMPWELIGVILQNRIVRLQKENLYEKSVEVAVDYYAYTNSERAVQTFQATVTNYLAWLNRGKEYREGTLFSQAVAQRYGWFDLLRESSAVLLYNQANLYLRKGEFNDCLELLNSSFAKELLSLEELEELHYSLVKEETRAIVKGLSLDEAISYFEEARERVSEKDLQSIYEYTVVNAIGALTRKKSYEEAWSVAKALPTPIALFPEVAKAIVVTEKNYEAEFHNKFAAAFNKGLYKEALAILEQGLTFFPKSRVLNSDKKRVVKKIDSL